MLTISRKLFFWQIQLLFSCTKGDNYNYKQPGSHIAISMDFRVYNWSNNDLKTMVFWNKGSNLCVCLHSNIKILHTGMIVYIDIYFPQLFYPNVDIYIVSYLSSPIQQGYLFEGASVLYGMYKKIWSEWRHLDGSKNYCRTFAKSLRDKLMKIILYRILQFSFKAEKNIVLIQHTLFFSPEFCKGLGSWRTKIGFKILMLFVKILQLLSSNLCKLIVVLNFLDLSTLEKLD